METFNVLMNGSATPNVIGLIGWPLRALGSGLFAISSSRWFCQKQSPHATTSTTAEMMMRLRSSSKCSTSVICSSNCAGLNRATAQGFWCVTTSPSTGSSTSCALSISAGFEGSSSSSSFLPEIEPRNSRMPLPIERPSSGRRFGPKITRAMMRTTTNSSGPTFGIPTHGTRADSPATELAASWQGYDIRAPGGPASAGDSLPRMILSDKTIRAELEAGGIVIEPLADDAIQPSSVDLHVDRFFRVFRNDTTPFIDPKAPQDDLTEYVEVDEDRTFILHPGEFVLGSTRERVALGDDLVGRLEGKSSLGRLGLLIHSTAGFVDAGWDGHLTLELSNVANLPIAIYPGMKIGQISFLQMTTPAEHPYGSDSAGSKYQGQRGPTPSRYYLNFPDNE